ncbi:hypothetical protein TRFO_27577 [Tritrichomonas foetus]|uniref:Right handed beta helix domain-containing protein n=1 Tax=Tritrichomonas foetus TaxID=1144522 RepID=A0A1J4K599_9EUKA|nr:hypothetical protein TRFO_27577 [Tritrichomonas foetus]|eukprot:OHT04854.1 hypothetical protein TRFO_27577 [Tritrichomonas foetus]
MELRSNNSEQSIFNEPINTSDVISIHILFMLIFFSLIIESLSLLHIESSSIINVNHISGDPKARSADTIFFQDNMIKIKSCLFNNTRTQNEINKLSPIKSILFKGGSKITKSTFQNYNIQTISTDQDSYENDGIYIDSSYEHSGTGILYMTGCSFSGNPTSSAFYASTSISKFVLSDCLFDRVKTDGTINGASILSYASNFSLIRVKFSNHYRQSGNYMCYFRYGPSGTNVLSDPIIFDGCIFSNITHDGSSGTGIHLENPTILTFNNCSFSNTNSGSNGGALKLNTSCSTTTLTIQNCKFIDITSNGSGGAIDIGLWSKVYIDYCTFIHILLDQPLCYGGVISIIGDIPNLYIRHNYFDPKNPRNIDGGAIYTQNTTSNYDSLTASIENNTFINTCGGYGNKTSIYIRSYTATFTGNTFMDHTTYSTDSSLIIFEAYGASSIRFQSCVFQKLNSKSLASFVDPQYDEIDLYLQDCIFTRLYIY